MSHLLRPRATKIVSSLLSPLIVLSSFLAGAPAGAQVVEIAPRAIASSLGAAPAAVTFAPAALGAPSLSGISALSPAAGPAASAPILAPALSAVPAAAAMAAASAALPALPAASAPALAASDASPRAASPAEIAGPAAPRTLVGRLAQSVVAGLSEKLSSFFDGGAESASAPAYARAILTTPVSDHRLRPGVRLDAKPQPSDKGSVKVKDFHVSQDHALDNGAAPIKLNADAGDAASVEASLRALVDSNPTKYGASSADMAKVHVQFVPGSKAQGQADTYYAIFRQWKQGVEKDGSPYHLLVDGGSLTFVIKVLADGKPTVMATEGRLYPGVDAEVMTVNFTDDQMTQIATKRLQSPPDAAPGQLRKILSKVWDVVKKAAKAKKPRAEIDPPVFLTRQLTQVDGTWRALNLYQASDLQGLPLIVAVDVKSGEAFAWSAQELLRDGGPIASGAGTATARGTTLSATGSDHGPIGEMALPNTNVYDASGKVVAVTDADGKFTVPGSGTAPVSLTIRLEGKLAMTTDEDLKQNGPLQVTVTAAPGASVRAVLNPTGTDEELAAEVNGYVYFARHVAWLRDNAGVTDPRILLPLAGGMKANRHDMPGNAYYSPADDSVNLQAAATVTIKDKKGKPHKLSFENTAQPSIILHEVTHRAVQILSQVALSASQAADAAFRFVAHVMDPVMDGGVNEAIADTVSMFIRNSPLIGEGFYVNPPPGVENLIRTGENDTVFDPKNPDPHAQGEAYMGFTWTVRKGLIEAMGEAAGAAYAALLVVPTTLYSQPHDVASAMFHVLLGDMKTDGTIPHEDLIRSAAKAHGPELPAAPAAR